MLFNSLTFLLFLPCALAAYHLCPRRFRGGVLLAASYVFYAGWDVRFLSLVIVSTLLDFLVARAIPDANRARRRLLLLVSVVANLGILGVFKYLGFFVAEARRLLSAAGLEAGGGATLEIILPMGISFYTFQTLASTIDVYRGHQQPCRNLVDYAVFVAYFPQLVAGPIERAARLIPQIQARPTPSATQVRSGLALILIGLFKKVVVGDGLLASLVDAAFAAPGTQEPALLFLCALLFSLELYVDFSGYSDIARGTSRLFGIELMVNFTQPLLSENISEFWGRWHISLSSWLRDYLYVPLGGNRGSGFATYRNLMITMLLGGLWHGASWNFVIWGGLHGLYLGLHRALVRDRRASAAWSARWPEKVLGIVATNLLVAATLIFFRAADLETAVAYFEGLAPVFTSAPQLALAVLALGAHFAVVLAIDLAPRLTGVDEATEKLPAWARTPLYAALMFAVWTAWPADESPFIYFQF